MGFSRKPRTRHPSISLNPTSSLSVPGNSHSMNMGNDGGEFTGFEVHAKQHKNAALRTSDHNSSNGDVPFIVGQAKGCVDPESSPNQIYSGQQDKLTIQTTGRGAETGVGVGSMGGVDANQSDQVCMYLCSFAVCRLLRHFRGCICFHFNDQAV